MIAGCIFFYSRYTSFVSVCNTFTRQINMLFFSLQRTINHRDDAWKKERELVRVHRQNIKENMYLFRNAYFVVFSLCDTLKRLCNTCFFPASR